MGRNKDNKEKVQAARITEQSRADIRLRLPRLLEDASSSAESAQEALRACLTVRSGIPRSLLTSDNIANTLKVREIIGSLDRLAITEVRKDVSSVLAAIRSAAERETQGVLNKQFLSRLTRSLTTKLLRISGTDVSKSKQIKVGKRKGSMEVRFTAETVSSAAALALWTLRMAPERHSGKRVNIYPVALQWVRVVNSLWRIAPLTAALGAAAQFMRSLRSVLSPVDYAKLESDPMVSSFFLDLPSASFEEAPNALLNGRLKDLETLFSLIDASDNERTRFLSKLRDVCQSQAHDVPPEAIEWVARHIDATTHQIKAPSPSDESQSSELDYICVCLLSAWDAASESKRSERVLEDIRHLARELFKVDLSGTPGEIVSYDERQHDLKSKDTTPPSRVEIIRPAVRWSDGIRTRILIRAVVRAA